MSADKYPSIFSHQIEAIVYLCNNQMRELLLVNQLWVIVPVNPQKNQASSDLLYKNNGPQVSMGYLVNKPLQAAGMSADNVRG